MSKRETMPYYGYRDGGGASDSSGGCSESEGGDSDSEGGLSTESSTGQGLPYPGFTPVALRYLTQETRPRSWCLKLITNPWFERISMLVILLNCVTLGMYQPCVDDQCVTNRCKILQVFDDIIFAFFTLEMSIKMVAMGVYGHGTYLADSWNRLDFFIVMAGALEYALNVENINLSAIRTIRVLRPLRAINRIPSMRILVMLLLDTLPMLGNVLLLCFFVFFIFGIVGVQLWEGILRQRCELVLPPHVKIPNISYHYEFSKELDYICTTPADSGMHTCGNFPPYRYGALVCNETAKPYSYNYPTTNSCVNWNQYYTNCSQRGPNPFQGTISFDNIGLAWVAIFLVISLEGWTDIMYYVQDAHSFWDWIYFVLLIVIGSFFMINLCLVVIATQFSETKKREMERMRAERARFTSSSTLASSTNNSEPATCYAEIVKYVAHLWRRFKRRMAKKIRVYRYQRAQLRWRTSRETLQLPANKPKQHHPCCPRVHPQQVQGNGRKVDEEAAAGGCGGGEEPLGRPSLLRVPSLSAADLENASNLSLLSPPSLARRRSSVMFSDTVLLHTPNSPHLAHPHNVCSSEKMTQTDSLCQRDWLKSQSEFDLPTGDTVEERAAAGGTMSCQELLALSGALSAALPTGQVALDSFFEELTKGISKRAGEEKVDTKTIEIEDFSCCADLIAADIAAKETRKNRFSKAWSIFWKKISKVLSWLRKHIKNIVDHKYFQQGILLAILINTLSMGIEYHNQPEELTVIVEISNVVFSAIFAVEMLLKIVAEGPFKYISNGFNVFDGVIVILSAFELAQSMRNDTTEMAGSSGLSVLRTFRLLRILKLVRFMPNLRRQLFVMLRTMDNVAVFFSLLVLFIFIFSILGMYLFGGKFCKYVEDNGTERDCTCPEIISHHPKCECDRKHFNNILWATVTVFQVLTQEDWNVVLFNGMEKTSHWAALYFVALMTFGNYVLFNLLVAILVEGFSSERNERREREQRELAKSKLSNECFSDNNEYDESNSGSHSSDSFSQNEIKNYWRSADDVRKAKDDVNGHKDKAKARRKAKATAHQSHHPTLCKDCAQSNKCNLQKESKMLAINAGAESTIVPMITHTAATPQDSPSTTLEPGASFRDFNMALSLERSSMLSSLDSIDRTSCASIPGLLKPPNSYTLTLHSAAAQLGAEKARLPPMSLAPPPLTLSLSPIRTSGSTTPTTPRSIPSPILPEKNLQVTIVKEDNLNTSDKSSLLSSQKNIAITTPGANEDKCRVQRGYSWRLSRPSLRKKPKHRTGSDSDAVVLNNGRDHATCNGSGLRKNELLLSSTIVIKNDTQSELPNNRSKSQLPAPRVLAPPARRVSAHTTPLLPDVSWKAPEAGFSSDSTVRLDSVKPPPHRLSLTNDYLTVTTVSEVKASNLVPPGQVAQISTRSTRNEAPLPARPNNQPLPLIKQINEEVAINNNACILSGRFDRRRFRFKDLFRFMEPTGCLKEKEDYSLYIFAPENKMRRFCTWMVTRSWFDNIVLLFIALNCITLAMERPNIPPDSKERAFLSSANYVFTAVFAVEMFIKVIASGMFYGPEAYFTSGWNIMDGSLVIISIIDLLMSLISESSPRIFGILRVFRLLRSLRPLRVINRAPGLKLVVQTLLSSLRPIGNIVLICCTFFIIFGILGVQLFKGAFFYCEGANIKNVKNKTDCLAIEGNVWVNRKYNFDDLGKALMSLFVLSSRDGWVNIMYTGLDAVGVDQQPIVNYSEWRLLYFIAFILLVGFFVLNMFVGVVVENFHRCREEQEKEERVRRAAKRALQMEKKRRKMHQRPYYSDYSQIRLFVHNVVTSKYFDLAIAGVIGLNVVTMAIEYYRMPPALQYALKIFNYFFTAVFILEAVMKLVALGFKIYLKDKWNQLDVIIVILSIVGIVLEELETNIIPINPTIMRVMRVLRIARVLKLLKMAKGIRALLDTVMQALPQVGNLGLLFFLLFFIFAALGVELFGRLECSDEIPCQGLGEHAHFANFGMAFLTLFRVATGDNWNGIMKDTLREDCDSSVDCVRNCCVSTVIAPIFFVVFVLMAQFVLVNVVVAVLMKHLEESHKQMEDEIDMDVELERELEREADDEEDRALCRALEQCMSPPRPLNKVPSLPANFTYSEPKQPAPSPARRRRTMHSHHALLPAALPPRRASLSPHAFGRRRQDSSSEPPAALYEEDARFIDADDIDELEPGSPPRRDSFANNRRQRVDKRNSLRGEEARLLRPAPVLLAVPTTRQTIRINSKRRSSTESAVISEASHGSIRSHLLVEGANQSISEEEKIRIVIAERRKNDTTRPETDDVVELSEQGS
ncbi:voltage-dependent T-type calcium channel subunit alpha-1G-like isoform X3 [Plodia interpunctella]|uniref:voltage-dependent T-type calcium channel subunit alpha-1G-like isoform X3 n=1 Tax=Plodia interpunctella TaxID=58824 RepID=UPI002368974B|nr:voltage-dependent T-type calcium channel subunit alpha-1G-like isoform X3 [Plodia interpunctella]